MRFVDRQGHELYSSRTSKASPVKALGHLRAQPLPDGERQRITRQWALLAQRLDRDGVPDIVRQGVVRARALRRVARTGQVGTETATAERVGSVG